MLQNTMKKYTTLCFFEIFENALLNDMFKIARLMV